MQLVRAIARAIGIAIALGLAILASAAPASAAEKKDYGPKVDRVSLSDWYEVRGPGFSLFARGDKKRVVSAGKRLLSFIEVVQATTNIHKLEPRAPIRIFMLEMLDYYRFGPRGSGGVAFTETAPWQLVVNRDVGSSRETLLHEYTHFLTTNHGQAYPRWFEEGFAELLSTLRFKEDLAYVGAPPGGRLAVVQREGGLPLRAILGAREYPDMIQWFYAQSWLLTHYLHTAHAFGDPRQLESMQRYLSLLHQNTPWETAFNRAFEQDVDELEELLEQHRARLRKPNASFPVITIEIGLPDRSRLSLFRVSKGRIAELLGDLKHAGHGASKATEDFYRKSLDLDSERVGAQASLAIVLAEQGRFDRAAELAAVPTGAADPPELRLARARVQSLAARASSPTDANLLGKARTSLRAIVQDKPDELGAWLALGESYLEQTGDPAEGIAAIEHVRAEAPRLTADLTLAKLYMAAERRSDARRELRSIVRWHGSESADEARELLKELRRLDAEELFTDPDHELGGAAND